MLRGIVLLSSLKCCLLLLCVLLDPFLEAAILRLGNPLKWQASKPYLQTVRLSGIQQFIHHYQRCQELELPHFYWGDEIEYGIFTKPNKSQPFDLSLSSTRIRDFLSQQEKLYSDLPIGCEWQPEYGAWMVEAVPKNPYGSYVSDLCNVEKSMQLRRKRLHQALHSHEIAPTISNFPMLGVSGYSHTHNLKGKIANSDYISDNIINPHPRFGALTQNIRMRRGSNVNITIPRDNLSSSSEYEGKREIHMDAMAFGMGCCCLQVTMQCRNELESRYLNDQLGILAPLLQALSAATPIFRGQFAATDTRWNVISQAVDDRTIVERGLVEDPATIASERQPALVGDGVQRLQKSRYSTISSYLAKPQTTEELEHWRQLNDLRIDYNPEAYALLKSAGIDEALSIHIAHLFTRDPLVIFDDAIELNNSDSLDHFENIQSTNWRSMRWKLPSLRLGKEYELRQREILNRNDRASSNPDGRNRGDYLQVMDRRTVDQSSGVNNDEEDEDDDLAFDHNILFEDRFDCVPSPSSVAPPSSSASSSHSEDSSLLLSDLQSYGPGWRIEFRPLEVQLTDYENAAFAIISVLLARCIASQGHNFYLPMSYVEENMRRAQIKDAVLTQKFYIRRNAIMNSATTTATTLTPSSSGTDNNSCDCLDCPDISPVVSTDSQWKPRKYRIPSREEIEIVELTMDEIMNGEQSSSLHTAKGSGSSSTRFKGLIPMLLDYINSLGCDDRLFVTQELLPYFTLLSDKARGDLPTTARWIREQLLDPYSVVNQRCTSQSNHNTIQSNVGKEAEVSSQQIDALLQYCEDIGMGRISCPELYGFRQQIPYKLQLQLLQSQSASSSLQFDWRNHIQRIISNLDLLEEEDLMFTNFTCFIKPVALPTAESFRKVASEDARDNYSRGTREERMAKHPVGSRDIHSLTEMTENTSFSTESTSVTSSSAFSSLRKFVKYMLPTRFFPRKKRKDEERIRF